MGDHNVLLLPKNDRKVVFVTGCAKGGIGFEYCKAFAERNCRVFASDLPGRMHDMSDLLSEDVEALEVDVSSDDSVASAVETIIKKCGQIDVVINNAGISSTGPLAEMPLDIVRQAWEINTLGQLRVVQHVAPHMASRRSGCIVNVGSVVGLAPTPWAGSYCSSKAAVHAMSHALRVELRPFGVNVVLVLPGAIRSNFGSAAVERLGLQDWRLYHDFKESIAERAKASQGAKATDAGLLARHVASKVLSQKPPKQIVFGHMTGLFAILTWSPLWVRDLFFSKRFKLNKKL
ncbi:short-chain dehydrogenase ptmH-like [Magnolia sinica]|uniref:short-chain dehydrogenase ptmH-like n=1 Tax=Magnolia sinica TaxID=86752 RepID=UPI002658922C|nr:short-chain dehydrogenase ptmH-like [Magnolia sinica]